MNLKIVKKGKKKVILTKNLVKGEKVYGERLYKIENIEYREWNPYRSKLAAAIIKKVRGININKDSLVLYLGAASGTTVSHISDIVTNGLIFSVEFSYKVIYNLVLLSYKRKNIIPIYEDANFPERYLNIVLPCDIVIQDIAQRNQVDIFLKNINYYLKKDGIGVLFVKSRSIDVTKTPDEIFKKVRNELSKKLDIIDFSRLEPYEKDHAVFVCKL